MLFYKGKGVSESVFRDAFLLLLFKFLVYKGLEMKGETEYEFGTGLFRKPGV